VACVSGLVSTPCRIHYVNLLDDKRVLTYCKFAGELRVWSEFAETGDWNYEIIHRDSDHWPSAAFGHNNNDFFFFKRMSATTLSLVSVDINDKSVKTRFMLQNATFVLPSNKLLFAADGIFSNMPQISPELVKFLRGRIQKNGTSIGLLHNFLLAATTTIWIWMAVFPSAFPFRFRVHLTLWLRPIFYEGFACRASAGTRHLAR